jgi:lipopolysaccharide biosynthesis glycosyltransferase
MEIVYVFDKNYIPYFEMSVQSVLKFNPNAHITVVSPEKLDIPYKNVVIPIGKQKHRENDRITDATYLKLMLPKLPLDKIIYIDADVLCLGSLNELWKMDLQSNL